MTMQQTRFKWRELFRTLAPFWRNSDRVVNNNAVTPGNTCIYYHENYQEDDDLISLFLGEMQNSSLLFHLDPFWSGDYHRSLFISQGERWSNNIWGRNGSFLLTEFLSQMDAKIFVSGHQMSLTLCWQQEKNFWIWSIVCAIPFEQNWDSQIFAFQTDVK